MKVVLFCGGMGMRLRELSDNLPKPMVLIGYRPILWHLMKYYAHFGHKDFILCLGYRADVIKHYFLNYDECLSNDFVFSAGGKSIEMFNKDLSEWRITFADTGVNSNIGQRLKAVERYLDGEDVFLANYSDSLTDLHLPDLIRSFMDKNVTAAFLSVKPNLTYHFVTAELSGIVNHMGDIEHSNLHINGGYFVFTKNIFKYIHEGEELVNEPFQRLISEKQLLAYPCRGFWKGMDTFKDHQQLEQLNSQDNSPWEVWKSSSQDVGANRT